MSYSTASRFRRASSASVGEVVAFVSGASAVVKPSTQKTGSRWVQTLTDPAADHEVLADSSPIP